MTSIFYGIAAAFEAFFKIMPYILQFTDLFFLVIGTVLTIGWIRYMIKHQMEEKGYNGPENTPQR